MTGLVVWFAWKETPDVELEGADVLTVESSREVRDKLEQHPRVHHTTLYQRQDDGRLAEVHDSGR